MAATTLPFLGSLLINAGSGSDECCGLCGNFFDIGECSNSPRLPCIDTTCESCTRMWHILSSPTCPVCYGDYTCPRVASYQAPVHSSQLYPVSNDKFQQQSPPHSQRVSPVSLQSRYDAFYGADANSDDDTISDPGSPMIEEEDGVRTVSIFSNDDLREALILANSHAGTNFNFQQIEDEITLAISRSGSQTELAATLTLLCTQKASKCDVDRASNEGSQADKPFRCFSCQKGFKSESYLQQHLITHTVERRTCKMCGQVLQTLGSRRVHERMHRETDKEREVRLRKRRVPRDQTKPDVDAHRQNRHRRVPHVLG